MSLSLYDAVVPSYLQILDSTAALLAKAEAYAGENNIAAGDLIGLKLADDMLPFGYQIKSVVQHSAGSLEGVRAGVFSPDRTPWPDSFDGLRAKIAEAQKLISTISADEVNGFLGKPMRFEMGDFKIPFTAEGFLFSFSLPNMHFHATTAYDILRWKGLKIGKMDYLGKLQTIA